MNNKKKLFVIILLILFLGFAVSFVFLINQKPIHIKFSENMSELDNYDFAFASNWNGCANPFNESLVNVAHIIRNGTNYEITCQFGKLHSEIYYQDTNNSYVYLGYIKNCDTQSAKVIDEAVRTGPNCIFPVSNPIPNDLNNYYVAYFGCTKFTLAGVPRPSNTCMAQLQGPDDTSIYDGFWGVIDIKTSMIY